MIGVGFEVLARTPVPQLPSSYPTAESAVINNRYVGLVQTRSLSLLVSDNHVALKKFWCTSMYTLDRPNYYGEKKKCLVTEYIYEALQEGRGRGVLGRGGAGRGGAGRGYLFPCSPEKKIGIFPSSPKIKILILYVPCSPKLPLSPCSLQF